MLGAILFILILPWAQADSIVGGTELLPKGVRAFFYQHRNINLGGEFTSSGNLQSFDVHTKVKVLDAVQMNPQAQELLNQLSPQDRQELEGTSIVDLTFRPDVRVDVNIFGWAYGLSDKLMFAVGFPIIYAEVRLREEIQMSRQVLRDQAEAFRQKARKARPEDQPRLDAIAAILDQVPEIRGEHIQDYLVNDLGYEPLGNWQAQDIGDLRAFLHYNFLANDFYRQGARWGVIAPTGRKDNPDLLNDIAFGNQVWGTYIESRHDLWIWPTKMTVSAAFYYEYSLPAEKEMRVTRSGQVSARKESLDFYRGDIFDTRVGVGYQVIPAAEVFYQHEWHRKWADRYRGTDDGALAALASGTDEATHSQAYGISYSTVPAFLKKSWPVPLKGSLFQTKTISGRDTELLDYTALELQMYF